MTEIEEQRPGRDKATTVNDALFQNGRFRRKFDAISSDSKLSHLLYTLAKQMLLHRSGSKYEDMYWIDLNKGKVVASEVNCSVEKKILYSTRTRETIKAYHNLLTIHSHPDSYPPSIDDLNSNYEHHYTGGIVVGHNGSIFLYSSNEYIHEDYYKLVVEKYLKRGYNEEEAQINALKQMQRQFDIQFREV